jgi:hypothetical protein
MDALLSAPDTKARRFLLEGNSELLSVELIYALKARADGLERDDARKALEIGRAAEEAAEFIPGKEAKAVSLWTQANALDFLAELVQAADSFDRAAQLFTAAGKPLEASRTCIGHMETLTKLGRLDQAYELAQASKCLWAR